ncbi:MAG: hypothetical protein ACK415_00820 [Thermodesulfovibrionales bacterium]
MCQKFKDGICDIAGIEPEYVECVNESCCYKNADYERCRLYIVEYMINNSIGLHCET